MERTSGKNASGKPSTKDGIEAVRLCAFTPPGSPLDRHSVVVFSLTMNAVYESRGDRPVARIPLMQNTRFLEDPC